MKASADHNIIRADGSDLSFITVKVTDRNGLVVPDAHNKIAFSIEGAGEIVATDNGDPADMVSFASKESNAYFCLALVIVRSQKNKPGIIKIHASSPGLKATTIQLNSN